MDNVIDGARFGGIFVIGTGHSIARNRLLNLNTGHYPGEPDILRSGIYLGDGAARTAPARGNVIERNEITGFEMDQRCIGLAPGIQAGLEHGTGERLPGPVESRHGHCRDHPWGR